MIRVKQTFQLYWFIFFNIMFNNLSKYQHNKSSSRWYTIANTRFLPLTFTLGKAWGQGHTKCCLVPPTSCHLCICKVWRCYVQWLRRRCINKKIHNRTLGHGHIRCCPVPSTSYNLCTCKIWSCYDQQFRRRCIYKKIHYLTLILGSRSHKMLPSTLYIMWPMQL